MRLLCAVPICLAACVPCEPDHLDDTPDAGRGEVLHGRALGSADIVAIAGSGGSVACVTCGGIHYFDETLRDQRRVDVRLASGARGALLAASGDTTIVLDRDYGPSGDDNLPGPRHVDLFALSGSGTELWRNDLGTGDSKSPRLAAGPASVVVFGGSSAHVYDPTTGIVRYSTLAVSFSEIVPDATGGLFLAGGGGYATPGPSRVTVRHVDSSGIATWIATWTAEPIPAPGGSLAAIDAVAATQDGGLLVAVHVEGRTLDLGDRTLQGPSTSRNTFVIALAVDGGVQWTAAIGAVFTGLVLAAVPDGAVLGGGYVDTAAGLGLPGGDQSDSFIAHVARSGAIFAHAIGGPGDQALVAVTAGANGTANALVLNAGFFSVGAEMRIGQRTFDDGQGRQYYLLNISL